VTSAVSASREQLLVEEQPALASAATTSPSASAHEFRMARMAYL